MEKTLRRLIIVGGLFSLYVASTLYIHSSFLSTKFPESLVGLLYTGASCLSLIAMINIKNLVKIFSAKGNAIFFSIISIAGIITLALSQNPILTAIAFMLHFASNTLVFLSLDILIDHVGKAQNFGKIRGWYLTAANLGFLIAPLIAGYLADRLGYTPLFIFSVIFAVAVLYVLIFQTRIVGFVFQESGSLWKGYRMFMKDQSLRLVYIANFLLQLFYAWMVVYMSILLHQHLGISWDTIGVLYMVMLLAFPLCQMPLGYLTDRKFGEKEFMIAGLLIMGVASLAVGFLFVPGISLVGIGIILFGSRVGASILEVASEAYFFKKVPKDDINSIGFFRNTYPIAYIIGPLIGSLLVAKTSLSVIFVILGVLCMIGIIPLLRLKDTL